MENDDYVPAGGRTSTIEDGPALSPEDEHRTLMAKDPGSLTQLNGDVLLNIVRIISTDTQSWYRTPSLSVCALAQTCSHMRDLCMPCIFGTCTIKVNGCITQEKLPPPSVWHYIQSLRFDNRRRHEELCDIVSGRQIYTPNGPIEYAVVPELGSLFDPLDRHLRHMPHLRSVYVHGHRDGVYDISLAALKVILSVPHLREFKMVNHEIYPIFDGRDDLRCEGLAPVTFFSYEVRSAGIPPGYSADAARQALATILRALAPSLESLCIPSIYAPVDTINETLWPLLREFTLPGEHLESDTPYVCLLMRMPSLLALNLETARPHVACPRDYRAPFPWPTLEHLTLSHPSPDDAIYAILPSSIRSLSLHSWPSQVYDAHCRTGEMSLAAWSRLSLGAPLSASVALRVLQACNTVAGHLTRLHTEYLADKEEDALLQCITSAFPSLIELEIHRQCPSDLKPQDPAWRMNTLGRACASLTQLRALYVHTHLGDYPDREWIPRMAIYHTESQHRTYAETALLDVATALASMLAPSVETIAFLTPDNFWPRWAIYSVADAADGKERVVRYEYHRLAQGGAGHCWPF